jgi:hypothetical protein
LKVQHILALHVLRNVAARGLEQRTSYRGCRNIELDELLMITPTIPCLRLA